MSILGAIFASVLLSPVVGDVAWLWDESARIVPAPSTVVVAVSLLEAKGGGSGQSLPYGSEQEPFESRCTSTRSISGFVLSSNPPSALFIIVK